MKNRGPLILVLGLIFVLVFVAGARYGGNIEKMNKKIAYYVSLTPPAKPPTPTPTLPVLKYKTFTHKQCALSFLYPDVYKISKETTQSAQLTYDDVPQLAFSCEAKRQKFADFDKYTMEATESAKVNPVTGRRIYFKLNPDLVPLLDSSIEFRAK